MAYTTIDDPEQFFQNVLYTGNGGTQDITLPGDTDLQPDLIWTKGRDIAAGSILTDSARGINKQIQAASGAVEETLTTVHTAFNSDGFSLGSNGNVNTNGNTYVGWCWKAGTSFTNNASTNGADLASAGNYNRTSGLSIVTFTGNATADQDIYHGLNAIPEWMVLKNRTNSNNESWAIYHQGIGNTHKLNLNTTSAKSDDIEFWQDTTPTSTILTIGRQDQVNGSGNTHVVYCWAPIQGFSKFGTYTGNGSTEGPFIFTGFRPAWVITKEHSGTGHWRIRDNKRFDQNNPIDKVLYSNATTGETDEDNVDFLSNGFKIRTTGGENNGSGDSYIYAAFAESPFVNSNGLPTNAR